MSGKTRDGADAQDAQAGPQDMQDVTGTTPVTVPAPEATRRSNKLRRAGMLRRAGGVAAGVVLVGTGAAMVAGSLAADPGGGAAARFPVPVAQVPAGEFTAACPEPPALVDRAAEAVDAEFSPISKTAETTLSAMVLSDLGGTLPGSALAPLGQLEKPLSTIATAAPAEDVPTPPASSNEDGLTGRTAGVVSAQAVDGPLVLTAQAIAGQEATAGAALSYRAADGDLQGLSTALCQTPRNDFWILGSSTTVGSTSVLKLVNPSGTPATVDLELFGGDGRIEAPGSRGLLIPPGQSQSIVLGGLAAKQENLAVRVRTEGGRVSGSIQQSVLRGLTPGGVEILQPSAPAASTQVVSGVQIQDPGLAKEISSQDGYGSASPALQVVVPGGTDGVLSVRVYGPDGEAELPDGGAVTAAAGSVTSIPLDSLPAGDYAVEITSDVMVSAAVRLSRGVETGEPVDFAVAPSTERLGGQHVAVLPDGTESSLVFGAPAGRSEVQLTPVAADGTLFKAQVVGIGGGTTVTVPAKELGKGAVAVLISASGDPVYGSLVHSLGGGSPGLSVTAVAPAGAGQQSVPVNLGY